MVSEKQLTANGENSKLGGVKTDAGKEISKLNAITHGLLTKVAVVRGEDPEQLNRLRDNLIAERKPEGEVETLLVERIATSMWRLKRAINQESARLQSLWSEGKSYPYFGAGLGAWETLYRYETMIERQIYKALNELERLQRTRSGEKIPAPISIDMDLTQST